jgi:hypothetical protein
MNPRFQILPDGNLEITLDVQNISEEEDARLRTLSQDEQASAMLGSLLDADDDNPLGWAWLSPAEGGFGTSKDMIAYVTKRDEEDMAAQAGKVWWFPEQPQINPYLILLDEGKVTFTFGMEMYGPED